MDKKFDALKNRVLDLSFAITFCQKVQEHSRNFEVVQITTVLQHEVHNQFRHLFSVRES
jgi:hypothetical protein